MKKFVYLTGHLLWKSKALIVLVSLTLFCFSYIFSSATSSMVAKKPAFELDYAFRAYYTGEETRSFDYLVDKLPELYSEGAVSFCGFYIPAEGHGAGRREVTAVFGASQFFHPELLPGDVGTVYTTNPAISEAKEIVIYDKTFPIKLVEAEVFAYLSKIRRLEGRLDYVAILLPEDYYIWFRGEDRPGMTAEDKEVNRDFAYGNMEILLSNTQIVRGGEAVRENFHRITKGGPFTLTKSKGMEVGFVQGFIYPLLVVSSLALLLYMVLIIKVQLQKIVHLWSLHVISGLKRSVLVLQLGVVHLVIMLLSFLIILFTGLLAAEATTLVLLPLALPVIVYIYLVAWLLSKRNDITAKVNQHGQGV